MNVIIANSDAALQAITHGLGFQSTLKDYKYRSRIKVHYMTPEIVKTNIGSQCYFSPISAFDNLVVGTRFEIGRLGASISTFPNFNCDSIESYLRAFELSPFIEPAKNLLEIIKSDKLWIRPNLRDPISVVYTPSKSGSGAKVHLNATRSARADFMMTGEPKRGGTLRQRLDSMGIRTIYGRNTLKIMEGLGYATQMNPLFPVMEVSTTFATTHYNPNDAQWRVNLDFL